MRKRSGQLLLVNQPSKPLTTSLVLIVADPHAIVHDDVDLAGGVSAAHEDQDV